MRAHDAGSSSSGAGLAITCGLPFSGKSTVAKQMQGAGWVIVCPDEIRLALTGCDYFQPAEAFVWAVCETMARVLVRSKHAVVIDATNTTKKRRRVWLDIAREFDLPLRAFVLGTEARTCRERAERAGRREMKQVIDRMAEQWEPVEEEGIEVTEIKPPPTPIGRVWERQEEEER